MLDYDIFLLGKHRLLVSGRWELATLVNHALVLLCAGHHNLIVKDHIVVANQAVFISVLFAAHIVDNLMALVNHLGRYHGEPV